MKRFIFLLTTIFICTIAYSETRNLNWYNGDNAYSQTTCEIGGNLDVPSTAPTKYGYDFVGWDVQSAKELEYLSLLWGSYIDTDVVFDSDEIDFDIKFEVASYYTSNGSVAIFGVGFMTAYGSAFYSPGYGFIYNKISKWCLAGVCLTYSLLLSEPNTCNINFKKNIISGKCNDDLENSTSASRPSNALSIFLGAVNPKTGGTSHGENRHYFVGKIYYFRIKKNGVLIRDFVPAIDPNGVVCFYDRVENKFYYNVGGADFIAGPVVE